MWGEKRERRRTAVNELSIFILPPAEPKIIFSSGIKQSLCMWCMSSKVSCDIFFSARRHVTPRAPSVICISKEPQHNFRDLAS